MCRQRLFSLLCVKQKLWLAGVVGVFGGDGRVHQSLMATGGARRILTDAAVARHENLSRGPCCLADSINCN